MIGHNDRIAWGVTVLYFDVQDLYMEKLDSRTGRYEFRGQLEQARADRVVIAVKNQRPEVVVTWVTRHGPVIATEGGASMALRWTAADSGGFDFPFPDLNRAANWEQFRRALSRFPGPGLNFVYGDVDGNIGYQAAGRFPIRRKYAGDVPVDGSSGEFEWDGFIPFEQLPSVFNPSSGAIITANQNPFPEQYPYQVHGNFDSHFRSRQIQALLDSKPKWDPSNQLAIQTDLYSASLHFLAKQTVAAWDRRKPDSEVLSEPVRILREWNGQMDSREPGPFVATLLYQHIRRGIVERAAPGKALLYESRMAAAVVDQLLRQRPAGWFPDYDQFLLASLTEAIDEGKRIQGRDLSRWQYGRFLSLRLPHPVLSRVPYLGRYFTIGPVPMSGSSTSVKQTTLRLGPSMRMIASTADWDASLQNLTIGQSGQPLSGHFKDQWDAYYAGRSFRMQFDRIDERAVLILQPDNPASSHETASSARNRKIR
jgi:penicillin amidase